MFAQSNLATVDTIAHAPTTAVATLTPTKPKAPSVKAMAFNYASLFTADKLGDAFNADLVKQAASGRISAQFIQLAGLDGLVIPVSKANFDKYTAIYLQANIKPLGSAKRATAYGDAFAMLRDVMGLASVKRTSWAAAKKVAVAKPVHAMSADALAIVATVRDAALSKADLQALVKAIQAQIV